MDNNELTKLLGTKHLLAINADTLTEKHFWGGNYLVLAEVMAFSDNFIYVELRNDSLQRMWMATVFFQKAVVDTVTEEVPPHEQIAALEGRVKQLTSRIDIIGKEHSAEIQKLERRWEEGKGIIQKIANWFRENKPEATVPFGAVNGVQYVIVLIIRYFQIEPEDEQEKIS